MILSAPGEAERGAAAQRFCAEFLADGPRSKYLLGRNVYAESVARHVDLAGFVDDFTSEASYLGQPVIRSQDIPADALVLNAAGGVVKTDNPEEVIYLAEADVLRLLEKKAKGQTGPDIST